jgi:hypothetical protein
MRPAANKITVSIRSIYLIRDEINKATKTAT